MGQFRIIAGKHRGRKIFFADTKELRPTPDRVREMLFNWLMQDIHLACCLDLFAGSGALGIEALSRGASHVTFVDYKKNNIKLLTENLNKLDCQAEVMQSAFPNVNLSKQYDLIFLDPPFNCNMAEAALQFVAQNNLLLPTGKVYLETEIDNLTLQDWQIIKSKKSGQVCSYLLTALTQS